MHVIRLVMMAQAMVQKLQNVSAAVMFTAWLRALVFGRLYSSKL
jgi:hypothetical protein